jgi:hypothetical protein
MTTFREIRTFDVIGDIPNLVGKNPLNRRILAGPWTVIDIIGPASNWNSGLVEMNILVKSFDTPEMWVKVLPSDEVHIIVQR